MHRRSVSVLAASLLVLAAGGCAGGGKDDSKADVNKADAQRFTPLFWAVDRRNMETAPNFPWMVTTDRQGTAAGRT